MFSENLKTLRKQKGFSQEELASRLHVVRQTISKWEKNLSVPDADTLIRLAEILEVSVSELLGSKIETENGNVTNNVAEQLSRINEQLVIKNRRSHRIWKVIAIIAIILAVVFLASVFIEDLCKKTRVFSQEMNCTNLSILSFFYPTYTSPSFRHKMLTCFAGKFFFFSPYAR